MTTIGVDFLNSEVEEAIYYCSQDLEDAFRTTISYWYWKKSNGEDFDAPNNFLIKALKDNWHPYKWDDKWMENQMFKSKGMKLWDEAEVHWGKDKRNYLVVDIQETIIGTRATIIFRSGRSIDLRKVSRMTWEELLEYAEGGYRKLC
ncbi:hypothetical protein [Okeania sp. KiyG1]|uniref:hypothetical protein n=1 Tax=Okeania sp. KiyG1 TaxID=2720165 RepID=UPI00192313DE|nr:hypothetical protein [Okeania sp. KiyG1]GGA49350.1 hypothetical protein CYANOKiyG1_68530 [Okeania sp. KiyG1]